MMDPIRVRNLLSSMDAPTRASMKQILPSLPMPDVTTARYPNAILSILPPTQMYTLLGCIAEEMLRYSVPEITNETLQIAITKWYPEYTAENHKKVKKSKTTSVFLENIKKTRERIDEIVQGILRFDTTVAYGSVEGHPDAQTETQLFEVKMTGQLKKNWNQFLQQTFAYAALHPEANTIHLILPMQKYVWSYDLKNWGKRIEFRDLLQSTSTKRQTVDAQQIQSLYSIGNHVQKQPSLANTIKSLCGSTQPFQIFLGSSISSKLHIKDEEIAKSTQEMKNGPIRLYVHSPYIINLCSDPEEKDGWAVELLKKNLQYANTVGCKGVVVHVGKYTKKDKQVAMSNMRTNLQNAMEFATPECPLLLETPAGQGTETLTTYEEFTTFVADFKDPRIAICVDTCHVFACGHTPLTYIERLTNEHPSLIKLVHFNDSATACGSCLDRHAYFGTGHIGLKAMMDIADHCKMHSYPMVIE